VVTILLNVPGLRDNCVKCDVSYKIKRGTRCNNCPFIINMFEPAISQFRTKLSSKYCIQKSHFYFFTYYSEFNWQFPDLPCALNGEDSKGDWRW
jgi:hypothetical protein